MKASSKDKEFYFAIRDEIQSKLIADGAGISKSELHTFLKWYADLENVSLSTITHDELQTLKEWSKQFAQTIGLTIK